MSYGDLAIKIRTSKMKQLTKFNKFKVKIVGVGDAGNSFIDFAISNDKLSSAVEFVSINTNINALDRNLAKNKVYIGESITNGYGTGGDVNLGYLASLQYKERIKEAISDSDFIIFVAGLGGGTGSGVLPYLVSLCDELDIVSCALIRMPFSFEGKYRGKIALTSASQISKLASLTIAIQNDKFLKVYPNTKSTDIIFEYANAYALNITSILIDLCFKCTSKKDIKELFEDCFIKELSSIELLQGDKIKHLIAESIDNLLEKCIPSQVDTVNFVICTLAAEEEVYLEYINSLLISNNIKPTKLNLFVVDSMDEMVTLIYQKSANISLNPAKKVTKEHKVSNLEDFKITVIKRSGLSESFSKEKIKDGILMVTNKRPISADEIDQMVDAIVCNIKDLLASRDSFEINSEEIGNLTLKELLLVDNVAYMRYASVYKDFKTLDDWIDEIKMIKKESKKAM